MTRPDVNNPVFATLSADESRELLSRNHIGRLAFMHRNRVDVEPLGYVSAGAWLFMRSAGGSKLEALAHTPYVAFEVDEIRSVFDWRSVVVRGTIYMMAEGGPQVDRELFDRAIDALRSVQPEALRDDDPTPFRRTVYGIHIDSITGRKAEPG